MSNTNEETVRPTILKTDWEAFTKYAKSHRREPKEQFSQLVVDNFNEPNQIEEK